MDWRQTEAPAFRAQGLPPDLNDRLTLTGDAGQAHRGLECPSATNNVSTFRPRNAARDALMQPDVDASDYGVTGFPLVAIEARPPAQRPDVGDLCSSTKVPGSMAPTGYVVLSGNDSSCVPERTPPDLTYPITSSGRGVDSCLAAAR
jgi:hypothetical protein